MIRPTFTHIPMTENFNEAHDAATLSLGVMPTRPTAGNDRGEGKRLAGLTRASEQTIIYNACTIFGWAVLLSIAFWAMGGGAVVTTDADIYGPDELAHAQAERYGYE